MNPADPSDKTGQLLKKLFFYRVVSAFLSICLAFMIAAWAYPLLSKKHIESILKDPLPPPRLEEILKLMEPLSYSGLKSLQRKDVRIAINFQTRVWAIFNYHHFDDQGQIVLYGGREGLCGQLADFTFRKIEPLLGKAYKIEFVRAAEYGYFLDTQSSHYVLKITERSSGRIFYCDPTFKRYGSEAAFKDYIFSDVLPELGFIKNRDPHFKARVGNAIPILIRRGFLIGLLIDEVGGRLDKDNFALAITCTQQYKFSGRRIYVLRVYHGVPQMNENVPLAGWLLDTEDYSRLKQRMQEWFRELSGIQELPTIST